ncbi:hypothetical protein FALBO_17120 [Fusarium albosuccineum]|uniref:CCHC-type domain-containing protein n=1 Tax=Fusarium albosuccineum TaxID=1237068 RepID=A0A8H4K930_9HYPO|nr:hypothetical protein FALBO_17120 [Fusarium albosuccineum]
MGSLAKDVDVNIYIDHSNFWIQGRETYAKEHNIQPTWLSNWVFDIRNVRKILTEHSGLSKKEHDYNVKVNIYGSSCASMGSFWKNSGDENVNIKTFDRCPRSGREKEVDTNIVADSVEDVTDASHRKTPSEFILVSGDRDFQCTAWKIIKRGYHVHLWSWRSALSSVYRELAYQKEGSVTVHLLDNFLEEIGFKVPTLHVMERMITGDGFAQVAQSGNADAKNDSISKSSVFTQYTLRCKSLSREDLAFTPMLETALKTCEGCFADIMNSLAVAGVATLIYDEFYQNGLSYGTMLDIADGEPDTDSLKAWLNNSLQLCRRGKDCDRGLNCIFGHTEEEWKHFRTFGPRQFRKLFYCQYKRDYIKTAGAYSQALNQAFCATCGETGHDMRDCLGKIWNFRV